MKKTGISSRFSKLHAHGLQFSLDRELLASRSAKIAVLLKQNPHLKLSSILQDIAADPETLELVARFCHGFEPSLSSDNVIPLICLANYLEMTESHSSNNLLKKVLIFFEEKVLTCWNETIKAFRSTGSTLQQAARLGLFDACLESLVEKAKVNPCLLGDPIKISTNNEDSEGDEEDYRPNARRRLFDIDWKSEDLTTLSLQLYQPIIQRMNQHRIPPEYVAGSLCSYAEKWVFYSGIGEENMSMYKRNSQRDVIEAVERLLPDEEGLIPCTLLFKMLKFTVSLESSNDCRHGLEQRIGKQLHLATVQDLLIPSQGYAKETQYDIDCVRRILKHFYGNYSSSDGCGLIPVAELIEEFLIEVASDIDLKIDTFVNLSEMSKAVSLGLQKNSDGLYRAIDIYLETHRYLTEQEREEVCRMLDCQKMSPEACEHAAMNQRLPLRFIVQVLFMAQLQMRDTIAHKVQGFDTKLIKDEANQEREDEVGFGEEPVRAEMEKMSIKMKELEKECYIMRKEIESGSRNQKMRKQKTSMWKEMKRKLGCMTSMNDFNCQVKKKKKVVHPKY